MKKRILSLSLILILIVLMSSMAFAAFANDLDYVTDFAGLLREDQVWVLNDKAREISEKYRCDITILILENMDHHDAYEYTKFLIEEYDMGYGPQKSILMLMLSMAGRDYALLAHGYGNTAFTDHAKNQMLDKNILPLLRNDKYYDAFDKYLDISENYLEMATSGKPFDIDNNPSPRKLSLPVRLGIVILLPSLIAGLVCGRWKNQMKTAVLARSAGNYVGEEGLNLTSSQDSFLYRTETRRRIESRPSGGTTVDSSGYSGRSGKF